MDTLTIAGGGVVMLPVRAVLAGMGDGDVFYLESDPSKVWLCRPSRFTPGGLVFIGPEDDCARAVKYVGDPGEPCIVLHNTKLRFGVAAPGEGG